MWKGLIHRGDKAAGHADLLAFTWNDTNRRMFISSVSSLMPSSLPIQRPRLRQVDKAPNADPQDVYQCIEQPKASAMCSALGPFGYEIISELDPAAARRRCSDDRKRLRTVSYLQRAVAFVPTPLDAVWTRAAAAAVPIHVKRVERDVRTKHASRHASRPTPTPAKGPPGTKGRLELYRAD
jgi:hypothetical protein